MRSRWIRPTRGLGRRPTVPGSSGWCRSSRGWARGQVPRAGWVGVLLGPLWVPPLLRPQCGAWRSHARAFRRLVSAPLGRSPDRSFHGPDRWTDLSAVGERPHERGAPDGSRGAGPLSPLQTSRQVSRSTSRVSLEPSPCRRAPTLPASVSVSLVRALRDSAGVFRRRTARNGGAVREAFPLTVQASPSDALAALWPPHRSGSPPAWCRPLPDLP